MEEGNEMQKLAESETIKTILDTAVVEKHEAGHFSITMEYGTKQLIVIVNPIKHTAMTRIEQINFEDPKKVDETTLLYSAARKVMERYASEFQHDIIYTLKTSDKKMNAWVTDKGANVFDFTPVDVADGEFEHYYQVRIQYQS